MGIPPFTLSATTTTTTTTTTTSQHITSCGDGDHHHPHPPHHKKDDNSNPLQPPSRSEKDPGGSSTTTTLVESLDATREEPIRTHPTTTHGAWNDTNHSMDPVMGNESTTSTTGDKTPTTLPLPVLPHHHPPPRRGRQRSGRPYHARRRRMSQLQGNLMRQQTHRDPFQYVFWFGLVRTFFYYCILSHGLFVTLSGGCCCGFLL